MIKRRQFITFLGAAVAWPLTARGQQGRKVHRIGFLRVGAPPATFMEGFREGLREHGYLEGQNFVIEYGLVPNAAQLPDAAQELARRKVDVLVASGTPSVQPAAKATSTIPVVFVAAVDPLATGVVASLARPGGHVTGVTAMHGDVIGKRLQLLGELLPTLSRIAVLVRANSPATPQYLKEAELAGRSLAVQLQVLRVHETRDLEGAINGAQGANALLVADDAVFTAQRTRIAELALRNRLPTAYGFHDMVEAGGLMAYGPHYGDLYRRAAAHVHKLLNGARPADLPVEQPTRFELLINLKTAKALGLEVPPTLLAIADELIE